MPLKFLSLRLGFANNSSSSHSVLFGLAPDLVRDYGDVGGYEFGWDWGTVGSESSKMRYLAATVYSNLSSWNQSDEQGALAFAAARSIDPGFELNSEGYGGYVDHQSLINLPNRWQGDGLDGEFLQELRQFFAREDVAITLGNDNEPGKNGPADGHGEVWVVPTDRRGTMVARNESRNVWTLFNRDNGTRTTVSFDGSGLPERLPAPHLMDIKITDYCPFKCDYCYQGSTESGAHVPLAALEKLADQAATEKVFEVAIGGGEPTLHPQFVEVLRAFRLRGVVPNFTTYSDHWIKDDELREVILETCGSFAFSANSVDRISKIADLVEDYEVSFSKVTVQMIMGLQTVDETLDLLRHCSERGLESVTLLGYKSTGRGGSVPHDYMASGWLEKIAALDWDHRPYRIAIDTVLAAQSRDELERLEVPRWLYHTSEGASSMYIDMVAKKAGPSSYHPSKTVDHSSLAGSWDLISPVEGDA